MALAVCFILFFLLANEVSRVIDEMSLFVGIERQAKTDVGCRRVSRMPDSCRGAVAETVAFVTQVRTAFDDIFFRVPGRQISPSGVQR